MNNEPQTPLSPPQQDATPPSATPIATDPAILQTAPQKTYHPTRTLILVITGVVITLLVAAGVLFALLSPKQASVPATTESPKETLEPLTAKQTIEQLAVYFKGTEQAKTSLSTPIMAEGRSFYTVHTIPTETASIAGAVPVAESSSHLEALKKSLDYDKFSETVLEQGEGKANFLASYLRADVICQIFIDKAKAAEGSHYLEVKCLDMKQYEDLANDQEIFYRLYSPAQTVAVPTALIGKNTVRPGGTPGYELAEQPMMTVVDKARLTTPLTARYFRQAGGQWDYFTDTPDPVSCQAYVGIPLRSAYANLPCMNQSKHVMETVKPPSDRSR